MTLNINAPHVSRPALAFRVGVTGARTLDPASAALLRPKVRQVLAALQNQLRMLMPEAACQAVYDDAAREPALYLLSPLAEGIDRLVAEEALALGFQLTVPLPFPAREYEKDFPATVTEFRALLAQAGPRVLELDGERGEYEARSYEAVGRLVVRNCDLLIAVFDGGPGKGRGGTAEIARFASRFGPPVWWLPVDGESDPVWVTEPRSLLHPHLAPGGAAAAAALEHYIARSVRPPRPGQRRWSTLISQTPRLLRFWRSEPASPLLEFLAERARPARFVWTLHRRMIDAVARPAGPKPMPTVVPARRDLPDSYWGRLYRRADTSAIAYGHRYRSSYVIVFGFAAFALLCAVLGIWAHAWPLAVCEFVALLVVFAVVAVNEDRHWQDRLITYRLLAELCRNQEALALLGWSLPMAEATRTVDVRMVEDGVSTQASPADAWVGWYFNALRRAAPLRQGAFGTLLLEAAQQELLDGLVAGQAEYHAGRALTHHRAARFFGLGGERLFLATMALVLFETLVLGFAHGWHALAVVLSILAAGVPSLSAALVGIRSYAELEMLAEQSTRMSGLTLRANTRMTAQPLDVPLASQELAAEVFQLADEMMRDLAGWTQLFSVKAIEAG